MNKIPTLSIAVLVLSWCRTSAFVLPTVSRHDGLELFMMIPAVEHILVESQDATKMTMESSSVSISYEYAQKWLSENLLPLPANAAESIAAPPSNEEIQTLRNAFAAFYGANRDAQAAEPLLTKSIQAWERQAPDERAGLYRVRGDCYMVLLKPLVAVQDYTTAIRLLQGPGGDKADPSELPAAFLGRARAIRSLSTTATREQVLQAVNDYESALKLSAREEWDTDQELLEDGARTNPYATWEYGMALRLAGKAQRARDIHILASEYFEDIGDPARSVISAIDAGIDASDYDVAASIGLIQSAFKKIKLVEGKDIPLLQRVIAKEGEGRVALASLLWSQSGSRQEAESQLGIACERLDQLEADAIARQKINPKVFPPRLKFNIDDGVGALDISCSRLKNKEYLNERLEWPKSLQQKTMMAVPTTTRRIRLGVLTSWIVLIFLQLSFFHEANTSNRGLLLDDSPNQAEVNHHQRSIRSSSNCPFRNSSIYQSVYVYPSPLDAEWTGSILSEEGKQNNISWPWLAMDQRLKKEGKGHYDANHNDFNQYTTELLIRNILTHPDSCLRTYDPESASLFYVPYLPSMEYHNGSLYGDYRTSEFGEALLQATTHSTYDLWESTFGLTSKYWKRRNGSDHILVMSEPLHGLNHPRSRRGNYHFIHSQKQLAPPIVVSIELSTTFVEMYPNCARKNILMPYPNTDGKWFNGGYDNQAEEIFLARRLPNASNSKAALIAEQQEGSLSESGHYLNRPRPLGQFYSAGNHGTCKALRQTLGRNYKCTESGKFAASLRYQHGYRKATFCPCPGGDSPSAKRHYDALHAGCIPIILSYDFVWPFTTEILSGRSWKNPSEFSIRLDAKDYEGSMVYDNQCRFVVRPNGNSTNSSKVMGGLQYFIETIPNREIQRLRQGALDMSDRYAYYQRRPGLPDNPLRENILPDGGAAHMFVQLLSERVNGQLWPACQKELRERSPSLDKVLSFKC
eukprot:scaffold1228_cov119-Cylindrotheca_fusiformis.AAC.10